MTPGKLDAVLERFRDHISVLYRAHGLTALGYWTAKDDAGGDKFIYLLAAADKRSYDEAFAAFLADPAFKRAYASSEKAHGKTVEKIESIPLAATDWSRGDD